MSQPITFKCQDGVMVPLRRFAKAFARDFKDGQFYTLVEEYERSTASHNQFFASVHDAWLNLPENIGEDFLSETHFRKWILIKAGYYNLEQVLFSTNEDARNAAALVRKKDTFAIVTITENIVSVFTAKSQSKRAMKGKEFQACKEKCFAVMSSLLGTDALPLVANAEGQDNGATV